MFYKRQCPPTEYNRILFNSGMHWFLNQRKNKQQQKRTRVVSVKLSEEEKKSDFNSTNIMCIDCVFTDDDDGPTTQQRLLQHIDLCFHSLRTHTKMFECVFRLNWYWPTYQLCWCCCCCRFISDLRLFRRRCVLYLLLLGSATINSMRLIRLGGF